MFARASRVTAGIAALLSAHCGYVGLELLEVPVVAEAGVSADVGQREDARTADAQSDDSGSDAAPELDASVADPELPSDAEVPREAAVADAALDAAQADAAVADAAIADAGSPICNLAGDWVAKLMVSVSWPATSGVAVGSSSTTLWMRYQTTSTGSIVAGSRVACGVTLPETTSVPALGGETYRPVFDSAVFDALPARVVGTDATVTVNGSGIPGTMVTMAPSAFVLGAALADPVAGAWPSLGTLVANQRDQDMDGELGVTVGFMGGVYPPIGAGTRADQAYTAVRFVYQGALVLNTCDQLTGSSPVSHFDTHFLGCHIRGGGACSTNQRDLFDGNRPIYTVNAATLQVRRVANATCPLARSTLP